MPTIKAKPPTNTARTTRASDLSNIRNGTFVPIGELAARILTNFPPKQGEGC